MKDKAELLTRLTSADTGWQQWKDLLALVESLKFQYRKDQYVGDHYVSGTRLCFAVPKAIPWPSWLPSYVAALYGMKADEYEMEGGYGRHFTGAPSKRGSVFGPGGMDEDMGFPVIDVPDNTFSFQCSDSGALFHINGGLQVLYPDAEAKCLKVLDGLDDFTRKCIQQALKGEAWLKAYRDLGTLID